MNPEVRPVGFPLHLLQDAYRSPSGEFAWRSQDVVRVIQESAESGFAAVGGEVWRLSIDGTYLVFLKLRDGTMAFQHWRLDEEWDRTSESWEEFCERAARHSEVMVRSRRLAEVLQDSERDKIRYKISFVPFRDYEESAGG